MSENMELKSLVSLASQKGAPVRADAATEKAGGKAARESRNKGFDGFMKTFLGKDKPARSGQATLSQKTGKSGAVGNGNANTKAKSKPGANAGSAKSGAGQAASKLNGKDREGLKRAIEKTVSDETGEVVSDAEAAEAAAEAARIIYGILYPEFDAAPPQMDPLADPLVDLAGILQGIGQSSEGLNGLGVAGLAGQALGGAIETANASAEMNIDAVLAALEDLLDGMPRDALSEALARLGEDLGLSDTGSDPLNDIAAALGMEIVEAHSGGADPNAMLGELDGPARQNPVPSAAETAVTADVEAALLGSFRQFLEENSEEYSPEALAAMPPEELENLLDTFAAWLAGANNSKEIKELAANPTVLAKMLASILGREAETAGAAGRPGVAAAFSKTAGNLESLLQNPLSKLWGKGDAAGVPGQAGQEGSPLSGGGRDGNGQYFGPVAGAPVGAGTAVAAAPVAATPGSSMLDQIATIERLADAMKIARQGGVSNLTLTLSPAELGRVMIRLEARDGVVSAILRVEKPEAAAELANNLQNLRENLKAQGIELGELDIRQYSQGQAAMDPGAHRERRNRETDPDGNEKAGNRLSPEDSPGIDGAAPAELGANEPGKLNLFA